MKSKFVYFVHGLGGEARETWGNFPSLIQSDPVFSDTDIGFFGFPTSLFRLPFSRKYPKIQTLAQALKTEIDLSVDEGQELYLVAHSLGGLIARQYLVDEFEAGHPLRVTKLLLYAVPNGGAGLASVGDFVSWRHNQLKQLCKDSDFLRSLNENWHRNEIDRIVDVRYVVAALDRVVEQREAQSYWGNDKVDVIANKGHIDVVKPTTDADISYRILQRFLVGKVNNLPRVDADKKSTAQSLQQGLVAHPLLIGFALDLSGSMSQSIRNDENNSLSRLASFENSLSNFAQHTKNALSGLEKSTSTDADLIRVFVQGFGLRHKKFQTCDLLSLFKIAKDVEKDIDMDGLISYYRKQVEHEYRSKASQYSGLASLASSYGFGDVVRSIEHEAKSSARAEIERRVVADIANRVSSKLAEAGSTTLNINQLAEAWKKSNSSFSKLSEFIYGATPMVAAMDAINKRFKDELANSLATTSPILLIISDGAPTDGNPSPIFQEIRKQGVIIVSCYVTEEDIAEPRVLYGSPGERWPNGAKIMFDASSNLEPDSEMALFLGRKGWSFSENAKLFVQVNHSEVLEEVVNMLVTSVMKNQPEWQIPEGL